MKYIPIVAGILLGLFFVFGAVVVLFNIFPMPPMPKDTPVGMFMGALVSTGYFTFVKVLELVGGILVAIPRTRNFGLLVLGPIIVNILAFDIFIMKGDGLAPGVIVGVFAAYLLWHERRAFLGLLK